MNFEKIHNLNSRVAIFKIICTISNYIGTLNKKITSYSSYSQLKTLKATIFISGFPKKACQGCHISKRARGIIFQLVSFNALGFRVQKYGNKSQMCWEHNTRTFSLQALCVHAEMAFRISL